MKLDKNHFYTTEDLFNDIFASVKETDAWKEARIDYAIPDRPADIYRYEFDPWFILKNGSSEGVYLDLAIHGFFKEEYGKAVTYQIGTVKTLNEGKEAISKMAALYGECLNAYYDAMDTHLDDMTRIGYDMTFPDAGGWGYSGVSSCEKAIAKWNSMRGKPGYDHMVLRDNLTRKETVYGD